MNDLVTVPRSELIGLIYELIDKVQALEAENAHLREQLHQRGRGTSLETKQPPDFVKANVKKKRKHLRKRRENSYHRFREEPTKQIFHSADTCPNCHGSLGKPSVAYTRQIIDLPQISYRYVSLEMRQSIVKYGHEPINEDCACL